jgi:hypothetical protein
VVFLALSPKSALEAIAFAKAGGHHVWVGADALTPEEFSAHLVNGVKLTRFAYAIGRDPMAIEDAIATIREHHPSEGIWCNIGGLHDYGK